ncbi:hypothetical protein JCM11491_002130 [Sporobolomyces phaffii]
MSISGTGDPGDGLSALVDSLSLNTASGTRSPSPPPRPNPAVDAASARADLAPPVPSVDASRPTRPNSTFVLFQPDCARHRYIRNHHAVSEIVERPERIRAVKAGVAAAWSQLERTDLAERWSPRPRGADHDDELGSLMDSLSLKGKSKQVTGSSSPFDILVSHDRLALDSPALRLVHGVPNYPPDYTPPAPAPLADPTAPPLPSLPQDSSASPSRRLSPRKPPSALPSAPYPTESPWPAQLAHLVEQVRPPGTGPQKRESEIPAHLPQGDLYLCPESDQAIFGALGAVCEGVDLVMGNNADAPRRRNAEYENGFVVIRPPGHHCGEANPQGFCFVNNVAVAAAHAHLEHGINRVLILDIDLHHGNGTQEIVWQINEKANQVLSAHRDTLAADGPKRASPRKSTSPTKAKGSTATNDPDPPVAPRPLQVMYSSLHDVLSYPCESGDPSLIAAASLQISGPHSQFIHNTHLEPYSSEQDFVDRLWPKYWNALGGDKAEEFLDKTGATQDETLILVSAGFDASTHEYASMSRHGLNVPPLFYARFAAAVKRFAARRAHGRVVFVLEGGYSDRALVSGSLGVLRGLVAAGTEGRLSDREQPDDADLDRIVRACRLEKAPGSTSARRKGPSAVKDGLAPGSDEGGWIQRTKQVFEHIDDDDDIAGGRRPPPMQPSRTVTAATTTAAASESRQLRERKVRLDYAGLADMTSPLAAQQQQSRTLHPVEPPPPDLNRLPPPTSAVASHRSDNDSTSPPPPPPSAMRSNSNSTAFASIPPANFYTPTSTAGGGGIATETGTAGAGKRKPAIKFVWKQGGIGGGDSSSSGDGRGAGSSEMREPRM